MKLQVLSLLLSTIIPSTWACFPEKLPRNDESVAAFQAYALARRHNVSVPTQKTAIKNVRVFNGYRLLEPGTVIIDGDKIGHPMDHAQVDTVVNGTGRVLIPGLMDSHLHASDITSLEQLSSYGITTAFNMACYSYPQLAAIRNQPGLTSIFSAGFPAVGPGSDHARQHNLSDSETIHNVSQAQEWVSWAYNNGSDYMKITAEGNGPNQETQNAMVKDSHVLGMKSMTHASLVQTYQQAITSKTDGIQHTPSDGLLTDVMISQMLTNKQFITPTMMVFNMSLNSSAALTALTGSPVTNETFAFVQANVRAMHEAGLPILAGTDSVGVFDPFDMPFGYMLHRELEKLVEVGFTPAEALRSATLLPSIYHNVPDRGVIKPGKRADLVLLNSNPLEQITNTRDIAKVWIGGIEYTDIASG